MGCESVFPALAFQQLLRRGSTLRATLSGLAGRFVVVLVLVAGGLTGLVSGVVLFMLPALALVMLLTEVLAASLYATSHNRVAIALVDAAWLALVVAAIMPIRF